MAKKDKHPPGRPTTYSEKTAATLCERLSLGDSLRTVCKAKDMPALSTVFLWIKDHPSFSEQYEKAQQASVEALAEDLLVIADDKKGDTPRDKLRVDTRKWIMSKRAPKKYGDKTQVQHSGALTIEGLRSELYGNEG